MNCPVFLYVGPNTHLQVLSRNHAVLSYRNGAFFLRDTKSSNGTFVNNERLAVTGEESEARQIFTGDIIQFGVEIVENTNKGRQPIGIKPDEVSLF